MAKSTKKEVKKPKSTGKKQQTVRERTQSSASASRGKRIRSTAKRASSPIKKLKVVIRPFRMLRRLVPGFIRNAWGEIKLVTWPDARQTWRLTMAVFIFSVIFATIVGVIDFGLDKLFREVIVGND